MMRLWRREVSKGRSSDCVASPWSSASESIRALVKDDGPGARVYSWVAAIVSYERVTCFVLLLMEVAAKHVSMIVSTSASACCSRLSVFCQWQAGA